MSYVFPRRDLPGRPNVTYAFGLSYTAPNQRELTDQALEEWRAWLEFELQMRTYHQTAFFEYIRLSTEFSKMVVSGLIAINTGGLIALPAIAAFLGIEKQSVSNKAHIFLVPAILYSVGLVLGLLCALVIYFNFSSIAAYNIQDQSAAIFNARHLRSKGLALRDLDEVSALFDNAKKLLEKKQQPIARTYLAAHATGWLSLICFIAAAFLMALHHG